jgi:glycosyltransferase involved in cell wall biosynthesis
MTNLNWVFYGDENKPAGYPYVAKMMRQGLRDNHVDLDSVAETLIIHTVPYRDTFSWYPGQRAGVFSMWEHSKVPWAMAEGLSCFDFAVVPCGFSKDLFAPHVKGPVHVIPHGIDPTVFYPADDPAGPFTVVVPATVSRKGAEQVVEGWRKAQVEGRLILKGSYTKPLYRNEFVVRRVPDMRDLYKQAHLCVSGSRGEGWDLICWEALACGVPTIVPQHTGYLSWGHHAQGWLTNFKEAPSDVVAYGDPGDWLVQDADEIADRIRWGYDNWSRLRADALRSSQHIRENYTWKQVTNQLLDALGHPLKPLVPDGPKQKIIPMTWITCVSCPEPFEIGHWQGGPLEAGVDYQVPLEVARVLVEAGHVKFRR